MSTTVGKKQYHELETLILDIVNTDSRMNTKAKSVLEILNQRAGDIDTNTVAHLIVAMHYAGVSTGNWQMKQRIEQFLSDSNRGKVPNETD